MATGRSAEGNKENGRSAEKETVFCWFGNGGDDQSVPEVAGSKIRWPVATVPSRAESLWTLGEIAKGGASSQGTGRTSAECDGLGD